MKKRLLAFFCVFLMLAGLLSGCSSPAAEEPKPEAPAIAASAPEAAEEAKPAEAAEAEAPAAEAAGEGAKVADAADMAAPVELDLEGLEAVGADALNDGVYEIAVDCSSSMFRIEACELTVADGAMSAVLTMGGTGYLYVYPGTGEEAAAADEAGYIPFAENADGAHTFTVPVPALDAAVDLAAFSKNKEMWYDRTLVFRADSLPLDAFREARFATAESLGLADGEYTVEVSLEGGSGKASVTSPAALTISQGEATAMIEWSSSNYDYMKVNDERFDPINEDGNSVFAIPVTGFDYAMPVLADTTAMSVPHEIEYTLYFDSATIQEAGE